jgi:CDP-glycerol glycerophosphotransferase (TagB/SpsB family)
MEVHHHPHVEKKNFKEYFLEFLMIFLAVTMGFFAEQMRESVADHNREKEFMKSMLEDLKTDTAKINSFSMQANVALTQMDSLIHLMQSRDRAKYGKTMYYFGRTITTKLLYN